MFKDFKIKIFADGVALLSKEKPLSTQKGFVTDTE